MFFQVLSHAGLRVGGSGINLICDPWLVGSAYWRSWWNYPPVPKGLVESLRPDFIYLTHIHWDHFHGPSLRKFSRAVPILIPKISSGRMKRDLHQMGFHDVRELRHGETRELAPGFRITSYQFYPFTDSAAIIECNGVTLFNANDAKFMGGPLRQILKRHQRFDFVFRSHSSANPKLCFDYMDAPARKRDDGMRYLRDFADFALAVGARYAIPFASNHCYLHKDVFHFNDTVITPTEVEDYFHAQDIIRPEVKVMACGDRWSTHAGFEIHSGKYFRDRDFLLRAYAEEKAEVLEKFYALEAKTTVTLEQMQPYFEKFTAALPWIARRMFKNHPVTYVLTGKASARFRVDLYRRTVTEESGLDDVRHPLQIHTSAYILRHCMALGLFIHLGISKRVLFRSRLVDAKYFWGLITLFDLYECEMLPVWKMLSPRFLLSWVPRWREPLLYARILLRKILGKPFSMSEYLQPSRRSLRGSVNGNSPDKLPNPTDSHARKNQIPIPG